MTIGYSNNHLNPYSSILLIIHFQKKKKGIKIKIENCRIINLNFLLENDTIDTILYLASAQLAKKLGITCNEIKLSNFHDCFNPHDRLSNFPPTSRSILHTP